MLNIALMQTFVLGSMGTGLKNTDQSKDAKGGLLETSLNLFREQNSSDLQDLYYAFPTKDHAASSC